MTVLRLKNVSLKSSIGSRYILQNISSDVAAGDRIAVIGASGAGKTSLLRLINRLSELSDGAIYINQQDSREIPILELRRRVTLILQESRLLGMAVREALAYPLQLQKLSQVTIHQRMTTWIEQLHLPTDWLDCTESHLSVGQRQLVAIARALMMQPDILLMDEPTSALDVGRSSRVLDCIRTLAESRQTTMIMVTHQIDLAKQFCNRVWYLDQGTLLRDSLTQDVDWDDLHYRLVQEEKIDAEEWN